MPGLDPASMLAIAAIWTLACVVRGTVGFGDALVGLPLMALVLPPQPAIVAIGAVSTLLGLAVGLTNLREVDWRGAGALLAGGVLGVPLGIYGLTRLPTDALRAALGVALLIAGGHGILGGRVQRTWADWRSAPGFGWLAGLLGGMLGTSGPPLVVWASGTGWSPPRIRSTLQGFFVPMSLLTALGHLGAGLWDGLVVRVALLAIPGIVIGTLVGNWLSPRIPAEGFRRALYVILLGLGAVQFAALA